MTGRFAIADRVRHRPSGFVGTIVGGGPRRESGSEVYAVDFAGHAFQPIAGAEEIAPRVWRVRAMPAAQLDGVNIP